MPLDQNLQSAKQLADEWSSLRDRLLSLGYIQAGMVIDSCLSRIYPRINERRWPPVWWRFMSIDAAFSDMNTYFFRMDAEGMFFSDDPGGYVPERDEILKSVERLQALAAR